LGLTPQMGWNSWNHYQCGINEKLRNEDDVPHFILLFCIGP